MLGCAPQVSVDGVVYPSKRRVPLGPHWFIEERPCHEWGQDGAQAKGEVENLHV